MQELNTTIAPQLPELYSSLSDDPDLAELVELFVQEMPSRVKNLLAQFEAGNWDLLARAAHQLKGSAGSYGFEPMTTCAGNLELAVKGQQSPQQIRAAVDSLVAMCRQLRAGPKPAEPARPLGV